jgi:hypothetical protein
VGDIIEGNETDKVTFGGQLIKDLLDTGKYTLVNATNKVVGGPFTRFDPSDPENNDKKSALSLCIVSNDCSPMLTALQLTKRNGSPPSGQSPRKRLSSLIIIAFSCFSRISLLDLLILVVEIMSLGGTPTRKVAGMCTNKWQLIKII